jgi:predicted amidophosphoribosyltransferase
VTRLLRNRMPKPVCPSCGQDRAVRRGGGFCFSCDSQLSATPQYDRTCLKCGATIVAGFPACDCGTDADLAFLRLRGLI